MRGKLRLVSLVVALCALLAIVAAVSTGATDLLNIRNPGDPRVQGETPPIAAPLRVPEYGVTYQPYTSGTAVTRPDGQRIARLRATPVDMPQVEAYLPRQREPDAGEISFALLGNIRYTGQSAHIQITTFRASPAAAGRPLLLGRDTVRLVDGSTAYINVGLPEKSPNRVAFVREGLIIAVSGDVAIELLKEVAATVALE